MVIPVVDASPACAQLVYFFAWGESDQISPGLVICVVTHVAGTASPLGAMMSADRKYAGNFTPLESIIRSDFTAQAFAIRKSFLFNPPARSGIKSAENWRHALGADVVRPQDAERTIMSETPAADGDHFMRCPFDALTPIGSWERAAQIQ